MADTAGGGFVRPPGQGRSIDLGNFAMSVKATEEQTRGQFSLLEATEPPGFGPPLHIHRHCSESFYVLEGEYTFFLDDRQFTCPGGSFVFIPPGMPHSFRVSAGPGRKLVLFTPAAMVGYFDDLSTAIHEGRTDAEALAAIAAKYSVEVVGPVPEGYM
jgi:mannose-6-phosphate isomerase-like protein (cupin superfamily)